MVFLVEVARAATRAAMNAARTTPYVGPVLGSVVGRGERVPLAGQVVVVTGAARGLGAEVARQAHAAGARVALVGRNAATLQVLADELGGTAFAVEADVTDLAALRRAATQIGDRFGRIDVVVANAGVAPPSRTVLSIDPDDFERTVEVDLLGQWRTVRAMLPAVVASGGHVLVVASVYAFLNGALNASYAASKAGVEQLVRALRVELASHGATAGVAYLGFVETDLATEVFAQEHVSEARAAAPAFLTAPMSVEHAAREVLRGVEQRAPAVAAPAWVVPVLAARGVVGGVMDEFMIASARLAAAVRRAEDQQTGTGDGAG